MKRKYKDFIILLAIFMLYLFRNSINEIIILVNKNFDFSNACEYTCEESLNENKELKKIIDFENQNEYDYLISRVKYRDVLDFTDELQIFKGKNDSIIPGLAVINDQGLIGVVKTVDKETSKIELITNKDSKISVKINNSYGILKSEKDNLIVSDLTNYDEINIGDEIFTSGIGNLPGNIFIGKVKEVILSDLGIEKTVIVEAAVNFNFITYLMVVKPS